MKCSIIGVCFLFLLAQSAQARFMKPEEAEVSILQERVRIKVNADGSSVYENAEQIKILNETGRANWGTRHFNYSPKNARLKVLKASTQIGENHFNVDSHDIVDTEINATENGFDESRQILVPFRKVEIGSVLSIDSLNEIFKPAFERQYSDRFYVGDFYLQEHLDVEMISEIPLFFEFNDPHALLEFTKSEEKSHFIYKIRLKRGVIQRPIEELRSHLDERNLTWFQVSNVQKATDVAQRFVGLYEAILNQELPAVFKEIVQEAKAKADPLDQINFVLASVADKVRYMGDWRAIDGAFVPRSLAKIGETHFGDCKDLSTLTVKILRMLGFESDVAWVMRGRTTPAISDFGFVNFNHAIVSLVLKERQLWLDPTNFQSYASGIFEDIAERRALVLNSKKIEFRKIEFPPGAESRDITHEWNAIDTHQMRSAKITIEDTGSFALSITGAELRDSKEQFEKAFVDLYTNPSDLIRFKFEPFELKSRIVKALHFRFQFDAHFHPSQTSLGEALDFSPPQLIRDLMNVDVAKRESDLQLEVPSEMTNIFTLDNLKGQGHGLQNCKVKSPWLDYSFEVNSGLNEIKRQLIVKKYVIQISEIKSEAFESFQSQVRKCGVSKFLVLKKGGK